MTTNEDDCETCSQGQGPLQRCAVCRRRVCDDCTNHPGDDAGPCVECELPRARPVEYAPMDNGAVRVAPPRGFARRWTTVADAVTAAPVDPGSVYPTMFILPPQENAEAAEKMAADVRRILGAAFDAGAKVGGA